MHNRAEKYMGLCYQQPEQQQATSRSQQIPRTKLLSQYARMMGIVVSIRDRYRRSLRLQENHFTTQDQSIIAGGVQEQSTLMRDSLLRVHVTLLANSGVKYDP